MLGRNTYTREEFDHNRAAIAKQIAAYKKLAKAAGGAGKEVGSAFEAFQSPFFDTMLLALDRPFVHRVRPVTGKDGNPLNEVELLCDSLMNNDGVLLRSNVIKLVPEQSVLKLQIGDPIRLSLADFERLSAAFFAELERKFV